MPFEIFATFLHATVNIFPYNATGPYANRIVRISFAAR